MNISDEYEMTRYKASLRPELHSALSAQLNTLVQLYAMPQAQRAPVWRAIIAAQGGLGDNFPIERAIANRIDYMHRLMAGEDLGFVPTCGRPPNA